MGDENKILKQISKRPPMLPMFFTTVSCLLIQPLPLKKNAIGLEKA